MKWLDEKKRQWHKAALEYRLRLRGICPEHGTPFDKMFTHVTPNGYAHYETHCAKCLEEAELRARAAMDRYEAETQRMFEEYKRL